MDRRHRARAVATSGSKVMVVLLLLAASAMCKKEAKSAEQAPAERVLTAGERLAKAMEARDRNEHGAEQIPWPERGVLESADDLAKYIETSAAWTALKSRHKDHLDEAAKDPAVAGKYFDVGMWLPGAVTRWKVIEKNRPDLLRPDAAVLDIGTGFGYFPLVGEHLFGIRSVAATDAPGLNFSPLYDDVTKVLGIPKYELFVKKLEPLGLKNEGQRYDLVTSYMMVFDYWNGVWGEPEWRFFLNDVRDTLLKEGGAIILGFNQELDVPFMKWAEPLGASRLGDADDRVVIVSWEALLRIKETQN